MTTYFPSIDTMDFNEDWLVESLDEDSQLVTFVGQGKNQELAIEMPYTVLVDSSDSLSVGELVHLPKELFIVSQEDDAKIDDVFQGVVNGKLY